VEYGENSSLEMARVVRAVMSEELHRIYGRARLDDRQINELLGLCRGLTADGVINQAEVEFLQKWLVANTAITSNPVISNLFHRVNDMLSDGILDSEESRELLETLQKFSGGNFELGEILKSSTIPFDDPEPEILFEGRHFCFTGTFAFGSRTQCEAAVEGRGAVVRPLTMATNFLVIGIYATDSWSHSAYGRKIEKAVEFKAKGVPIHIVGEQHWLGFVKR
jgi:NAD-dependent DNA ligase